MRKFRDKQNYILRRSKYHAAVETVHFAPTISPAPKNVERNEIESLYNAIKYYKDIGQSIIVIQPKYMGSYSDILLKKNINESRIYTRKGHYIDWLDSEVLINALMPLHEKFDWQKLNYVLIQAELMPWSALGEGLIEKEFDSYVYCLENHVNYLKDNNIFDFVSALKNDSNYKQYIADKDILSKKEINKKYPSHIKRQYEAWNSFNFYDLNKYSKGINTYKEQLAIFSKKSDLHFKPFNVLKYGYANEVEEINQSNLEGFCKVSDDNCFIIDFEKMSFVEAISHAYKFYHKLINDGAEGVMVKADQVFIEGCPPAFKVRNNKYLTMIYGVNFEHDFDYYLSRRKVGKKMKESVNQWTIAQKILEIPISEIDAANEYYQKLIELRVEAEFREVYLDSRL